MNSYLIFCKNRSNKYSYKPFFDKVMTIPVWDTYPGNIGTVQEGDPFSFQLKYTNPLVGDPDIEIISGQLPPGLTMNSAGLIQGVIDLIELQNIFDFTIRLTNAAGSIDRTFEIEVTDTAPVWTDPSNLGSVVFYSIFDYQFFVTDPGGSIQDFLKIEGEFPPGLELSENGRLFGLIEQIDSDTTYEFTIRAHLDGTKFEDRDFELTVTTAGNRSPIWNTPAGLLGEISGGIPYDFQFSAGDPDGDAITYTAAGIPPGFTLSSSGSLSGTLPTFTPDSFTFSIQAQDGFASSSRTFTLIANEQITYPITWITQEGTLGDIEEGEKSLLGVKAESDSFWLRYEITAGSLPPGLSLDVNTGDIWGRAQQQGADTTYSFTVRAYNDAEESFRDFEINVLDTYAAGATRVQAALYGDDKLLWYDLFTTPEIEISDPFRQGDDQYGLVEKPRILIVENLDNPSNDEIFDAVEEVRRTYLTLGKVEVAHAVQDDEIVYDVLYRKVYDDSSGTDQEFIHPQTSQTIKPGSLENLRARLIDELGSSGGTDKLPLWMTSEQIVGDSSSVLGWIPAIVFAYVQPGKGQELADQINENHIQKEKLLNRRVRIDRFLTEPAADTSFEPAQILFDNEF